jgi:hypothetical protein
MDGEDQAFQVDDVIVDNVQKDLPRNRQTRKTTVTAAVGGIDLPHEDDQDENAPLLSSQQGRVSGEGSGDGNDSDATLMPVEEYDQWRGLPWYKRPSVRTALILLLYTKLTIVVDRSIGFWYPLFSPH